MQTTQDYAIIGFDLASHAAFRIAGESFLDQIVSVSDEHGL